MPIKDFISSIEEDKVPNNVKEISEKLCYRDFITTGLLVSKMEIQNTTDIKTLNNIVPDSWIYIQDSSIKMTRFEIYNNWSPYMLKDFKNDILLGLEYCCNENDELWKMSNKEFIDFSINELEKIKLLKKENVKDAFSVKIKKVYPCYFGSYNRMNEVYDYVNKIENLYCIGRNGQHRYNNMDHSMLTAIVAVDLVKNNNKDKSKLFEVNTEKEYIEINKKRT